MFMKLFQAGVRKLLKPVNLWFSVYSQISRGFETLRPLANNSLRIRHYQNYLVGLWKRVVTVP
jgi:hypothetical protein